MKVENYITELEITALELNDYRTSTQNDGIGGKTSTIKTTLHKRKLILKEATFYTQFCTNFQKTYKEIFIMVEAKMSFLLLQ